MAGQFQIELDNSFADICLKLIDNRTKDIFDDLIVHAAAVKVHAHAVRFGNTNELIEAFWRNIVDDHFNHEMERRVNSSVHFLEENKDLFASSMVEVAEYLPKDLQLECKLYTMVGYDIGIVSEGSAFLNIAHPFFKENPCELIFMSMHEVHHVGYVHYNPAYSFSELERLSDLRDAFRYSTHLEGLAVYTPLRRRLETNCLLHEDYPALMDEEIAEQRRTQYFDFMQELERTSDRKVTDDDFELFEPMYAKGKRLWYVTGAYMAKIIDEKLGRDVLIDTVSQGPDSFFDFYNSVI
ncbi:MAG: DUF5700 domain-containing putative Zn-dependent protease [Candidatus Thorarchaeota archaeon]|jgi:hypothetical protein